eukprot:11121941-Ditylum_brightwellii.AAC.1
MLGGIMRFWWYGYTLQISADNLCLICLSVQSLAFITAEACGVSHHICCRQVTYIEAYNETGSQ